MPGTAAPSRPAVSSLIPGDALTVTVQNHPEWSVASAVVGSDGRIQLPVVGSVSVLGKTLPQLDAEIEKGLRKRLLHPDVTVGIQTLKPRRVTLQGVVDKPSNYEIGPGWRVSDAIAAAGGLRFRVDLTSGTLSRANQRPIPLDLPKVLENDPAANLELRPNDRLNFVSRTVTVQVAGHVNSPGPVTVPIGQGVVEALSLAGGPKANAALSKTSIQRGKTTIPVDLYSAITLGQKDINRPVREGDLILVPEATGRVTVTGAVNKPGYVEVPDGRTLRISEALAQAGGPADGASLTKAIVTHVDGTSSTVDVYKVTVANDQAANVALQPGDILTIPQSRGITVNGAGAVKAPGTYFIEEGAAPRVSDALARAGGLTMPPDSVKISILRSLPDGKQLTLDVDPVALIERGDAAQNARVMDGDLINVGSSLSTVYVNGVIVEGVNTVKLPGAYQLKPGEGVRELLARAGGWTTNAAPTRVEIQRPGGTQVVNVLATAGEGANVPLQPGDNIVVPALKSVVNVMPAVNKPGLVYLPEDRPVTVGEVLSLAGGTSQGAKIKEIAVFRIGPNKTLVRKMVSLDPMVKKNGYLDISAPVQDGDYIYVPEAKAGPTGIQKAAQLLSPLALLGRLF